MKILRTTILSLLYLCLVAFAALPPWTKQTAHAAPESGSYACILEERTYLYATADETRGLFILPATYYVKLLEYGEYYCRVEYLYDDAQTKKQTGYVKTPLLTFVNYQPQTPYFHHVFTVSYRMETGQTNATDVLDEITVACTYYGDYRIGEKEYCYVLQGESFGYVPKPADLVVPKNEEYAAYLASLQESSLDATPVEEEKSSPAQIAILVALCLLVPLLAALILKPPRRPPYETD